MAEGSVLARGGGGGAERARATASEGAEAELLMSVLVELGGATRCARVPRGADAAALLAAAAPELARHSLAVALRGGARGGCLPPRAPLADVGVGPGSRVVAWVRAPGGGGDGGSTGAEDRQVRERPGPRMEGRGARGRHTPQEK